MRVEQLPISHIIEWDIPNWSQLIELWTPVLQKLPPGSKVLAIGERNGGLSTWLALMGFKVYCTDRNGPSAEAAMFHKKYNVADKIEYGALDIVHEAGYRDTYDLIIAKSVVGGLKADPSDRTTRTFEIQKKAVDNIYRMLKTGGYFLSAENMKGSVMLDKVRNIKKKNRGWRFLTTQEFDNLLVNFQFVRLDYFGVVPTNTGSSMLNHIFCVLNRYVFCHLPKKYKYIVFAIAKK